MRPVIQFQPRPGILDLGWGHPRPELLPVETWARAATRAARHFGGQALTYGYATGPAPLLEWLSAHLNRLEGGGTAPEQTFVTGGASHGLALVTQVLAAPGDTVLVDSPTYHLAFRILADRGVSVAAAPEGLDPASLTTRLRTLRASGHRVPMLYLVPTFGNPTGLSLPDARRAELISVARAESLTIVEDDTYRELCYDGTAPASLWRLAGGAPVVRLGSFAKTVAPGLRLGWINADPAVIGALAALGYVDSGGGVNHSVAMQMAAFGDAGWYDDHLAFVRGQYRAQRDALAGALGVSAPAGGWFLWLPMPAGLLPAAEARGVSFVPGTRFYADGTSGTTRVRLSFSHLSPADLRRAAERLTAAVRP
ncbi:PLP-dependent aminotransferase family protein [Actinoplanes sp. TBRC 11911]|uniref:aminotransferase-like domain-containing protein n=1 Tax=Actinoplanes sp. TBRC 11911 TaxID=2729386 RepID=UPI00145F7A2F|nr:PLP-dependent aminotransferase family protein [Actinoplanes sp. TBRC 11911]NMO56167.1 PLP-dependent aminotransferase family protein [Actinoplanes sp. TBRC 11911]